MKQNKTGFSTALYVLKGTVETNGSPVKEAQLAAFGTDGQTVTVKANTDSTLLLLSGEPINEPVVSYGPFVMNNSQELTQAIQDYEQGKMGTLAADILH